MKHKALRLGKRTLDRLNGEVESIVRDMKIPQKPCADRVDAVTVKHSDYTAHIVLVVVFCYSLLHYYVY